MQTKTFPSAIEPRLLLGLLIGLAFWRVASFDFVNLDDSLHLDKNGFLNPLSWASLKALWTEPYRRLFIPVTYTVWGVTAMAQRSFGVVGFSPTVFHLLNLLLHAVTVICFVYPLLRRLVPKGEGAIFGAAIFAVHPLQVETVAWVSGLKDGLSGMLSFAALYGYVCFGAGETKSVRFRFALLAFVSYSLAIFAKPSAILIPLWAAILATFFFNRPWRRVVGELAIPALLTIPVMWLTVYAQSSDSMDFVVPPFSARVFIAFDALLHYLGKFFLPLCLVVDYGRTPARVMALPAVYWLLLAAAAGVIFWLVRRAEGQKAPAFFALYGIGLLPVLGFKPFVFQTVSTVGDRYFYSVMFVMALFFGRFASQISAPTKWVRAVEGGTIALLLWLSFAQTGVWQNSETLFQQTLKYNSRSWLAYNNLGVMYEGQQRLDLAAEYYFASAKIRTNPTVWNNVGAIRMSQLRFPEAINAFLRALELQPGDAMLYNNLGAAWLGAKDFKKARESLTIASRQDPHLPEVLKNLRKLDAAEKNLRAFRRAIPIRPLEEPG